MVHWLTFYKTWGEGKVQCQKIVWIKRAESFTWRGDKFCHVWLFFVAFYDFSYTVVTILWHSLHLLRGHRSYKMCKCLSVNLVSARSCKQSWSWNLRLCLDSIAGLSRLGSHLRRYLHQKTGGSCRTFVPAEIEDALQLMTVRLLHSGGMFAVPVWWVVQWPFPDLPVKLEDWGCGVTAARVGGCWMV